MRGLLILFLAMTLVFVTSAALKVHFLATRILPGVHVQGISVGDLTADEAVKVLARELPAPETLGVDVHVAGQTWAISWADAGKHYDLDSTTQTAYDVGRNEAGKAALLARLRKQDTNISPLIVPSAPSMVATHLTEIAAEVEVTPMDARIEIKGGKVTAVHGQPGRRLNIEDGVARVVQALASGTPSVELTTVPVEPDVVDVEPARSQAETWLAEPFVLVVETEPANSDSGATTSASQTEFVAPLELVSTWLYPQVKGQGIELCVDAASVRSWLEEIAPQVGERHPLDIDPTLETVLVALSDGQHLAKASVLPPTKVYTVQVGDTLSGIAYRFDTTVEDLKTLNTLSSDIIIIGQRLLVQDTGQASPSLAEGISGDTPMAPPIPADNINDNDAQDTSTPHSVSWREDLDTLVELLYQMPEFHEGGFAIVYHESFAQAVAALEANIPAIEDHEVVVGMMQILTMLGDAHTRVNIHRWPAYQENVYPLQLEWFDDGLFVTAVQPGYEDFLGLELVQIGDTSIEQVMGILTHVIAHESAYRVRAVSTDFMVRPVILHALGLTSELYGAMFVFRDAYGNEFAKYMNADSSEDMQDSWVFAVPRDTRPLYLRKSDDIFYWQTFIESAQALYFQYNVCAEQPGTTWAGFLSSLDQAIQTQPVEKIIIDLRRNLGGSPAPLNMIIRQLEKYPYLTQRGKVFVLIGNKTFSSGVYLTSLLQQKVNATLIGEPTAQGPNFYASPRQLVLPNSGIIIEYSKAYWESAEGMAETIQPDIWVELASEDYFAGRDPVLDRVLEIP